MMGLYCTKFVSELNHLNLRIPHLCQIGQVPVHEQSTSVPIFFIYLTLYFNIDLFLQPHDKSQLHNCE